MGKPFHSELNKIQDTIRWALKIPVDDLVSFIDSSLDAPLLIVGSGGSLTAAHMVKLLHEKIGAHAKVITPYELLTTDENLRDTNILFLTAGGRNPDIIFSFKHAARSEPRNLLAVCMRPKSNLKEIEDAYHSARVVDFNIPTGKDGFLATNSLVVFCTLFMQAYQTVLQQNENLNEINIQDLDAFEGQISSNYSINTNTFSVLYGKWSLPAAIDLESKFTEAAIGNVQIADFRNFAHGRHYWLAKNYESSGIVVIYTPDEEKVVNKTLEQIPKDVKIFRISSDFDGPKGALQLLIKTFYFVYAIANSHHIDPGCPTVPMFGRKIYRLNINSIIPKEKIPMGLGRQEYISIKRKVDNCALNDADSLTTWGKGYQEFVKKLKLGKFGSIVLDYDGTLISREKRAFHLSPEISSALIKLVENDIIIGIATGRGKSVREELQRVLPRQFWNFVVIGYYNGASIGMLDDDSLPNKKLPTDPDVERLDASLKKDSVILRYLELEALVYDLRPNQLSITVRKNKFKNAVKSRIIETLIENDLLNLKFIESSHSYDITPKKVSKKNIISFVTALAEQKGNSKEVLCIGDKGKYPGNDFELLRTSISLSVDDTTNCFENCWNIAPAGYRGPQAALFYLNSISFKDNFFHLKKLLKGDVNEK